MANEITNQVLQYCVDFYKKLYNLTSEEHTSQLKDKSGEIRLNYGSSLNLTKKSNRSYSKIEVAETSSEENIGLILAVYIIPNSEPDSVKDLIKNTLSEYNNLSETNPDFQKTETLKESPYYFSKKFPFIKKGQRTKLQFTENSEKKLEIVVTEGQENKYFTRIDFKFISDEGPKDYHDKKLPDNGFVTPDIYFNSVLYFAHLLSLKSETYD
jgi:hypothetical protein